MKNLYDRLNPENQDKLKIEFEKFPNSTQLVIDDLKSNTSFLEISYYTACELVVILILKDYRPSTISDLFNN